MKKHSDILSMASFDWLYSNAHCSQYGGFGFTSSKFPPHRHSDFYEITLVTQGIYIHTYNQQVSQLTAGSLILMAPYSVHELDTEPMSSTYFAICIKKDYFLSFIKQHFTEFSADMLPDMSRINLDSATVKYIEQLGQQLNTTRPVPYLADTILYITLTNLFHKKELMKSMKTDYAKKIIEILNNPFNLALTADSLCAMFDESPTTILKNFKEQTGYTIVEYKQRRKMEIAIDLLRNTDKKITDIAYESYYESLSYFLRSFKERYGMTPTEFRNKYRSTNEKKKAEPH